MSIPLPEDHGLRPWVNGGSGRRPTRGVKVLGDHVHARRAPVSEQQKNEECYYNRLAKKLKEEDFITPQERVQSPTAVEYQFVMQEFGVLQKKKLLEVGCGLGETAVYFAQKGAIVSAIDISGEMVRHAEKLAQQYNTSLYVERSPAEKLNFADDYFDFVFGNGILHHSNYQQAINEVKRVLKKGGKAIFIEPLLYNPIINIYRYLAGENRTKGERALTFTVLKNIAKNFSKMRHKEFWFLTQGFFLYYFFIKRYAPGKIKYWKKIIKDGFSFGPIFTFLAKLDEILISAMPGLKKMCWNTVIILEK